MQAELGTARRWPFPSPELILEHYSSMAVPELTYVWGRSSESCEHCNVNGAIVAMRRGQARILRRAEDWDAVVREWRPTSAAAAVTACTEVIASAAARKSSPLIVQTYTESDSAEPTILFGDPARDPADTNTLLRGAQRALLSDSALTLFRQHRARLHAPQASRDRDATWTVSLWTVQDHGAFSYVCRFRGSETSSRPTRLVTTSDSIRWPAGWGWASRD